MLGDAVAILLGYGDDKDSVDTPGRSPKIVRHPTNSELDGWTIRIRPASMSRSLSSGIAMTGAFTLRRPPAVLIGAEALKITPEMD